MLTLQGWDPSTHRVGDWLAARLQETYPLFAGKGGRAEAAGLVDAGRVAVILDGLDEIAEDLRPVALRALSQQAALRVVVLARSYEMAAAARHGFLEGAVALELQAVDADAAADYLTSVQLDPPPRGWSELTARLRREPGGPIAKALSNPLTLTLVRDTYRSGDDIRELLAFCDAVGEVSGEDIQDHLLDRVLPVAYAPPPGAASARYQLEEARRTLAYIAAAMSREGTRDLAWWRVPAWASAAPRVMATGVVFGLLFALGGKLEFGLVAGPVAACLYALADRRKAPARRAPLQFRNLLSRRSFLPGLLYAVVAGGLCGLFGLASGFGAGRTAALAAGVGVGVGLTGAIAAGLTRTSADDASPLTPVASWRRDQGFGLAVGLLVVLGLILGIGLGSVLVRTLGFGSRHVAEQLAANPAWIIYGLAWVLTYGLLFGLSFPRTWTVSLTFAQLAMRWHSPARLLRFLDDARQRNVLRTVGPVYQFRHARLQDRLAGQTASI
jgi:hypothetical protein